MHEEGAQFHYSLRVPKYFMSSNFFSTSCFILNVSVQEKNKVMEVTFLVLVTTQLDHIQ